MFSNNDNVKKMETDNSMSETHLAVNSDTVNIDTVDPGFRDQLTEFKKKLEKCNFEEKVIQLQRISRSYIRQQNHTNNKFFQQKPRTSVAAVSLPGKFKNTLEPRINNIINELAAIHAIIKPLTHITTIDNLKSILETGYFMGNTNLRNSKIEFKENALSSNDLKFEDGTTICYGPGCIHFNALVDKKIKSIKSGVCSLIGEIDSIDVGKFNQFFKLTDLCVTGYSYQCKINDVLDIEISKESRGPGDYSAFINISINFQGKYYSYLISEPAECIFYGNIENINKFCLTRLFNFLPLKSQYDFSTTFLNYLDNLSDDEIRKILILFSQALTIYSEYNFNGYLEVKNFHIKEIRLYNENIKFDLGKLNEHEYEYFLRNFTSEELEQLKLTYGKPLPPEESVTVEAWKKISKCLTINQSPIYIHPSACMVEPIHRLTQNFSSTSPGMFNQNKYIETRPHVYNRENCINISNKPERHLNKHSDGL